MTSWGSVFLSWGMDKGEFKQRTKAFGIRVIRLVAALPSSTIVPVIAQQLVKCSTSVGANYRAACRARSTADFIAKLKIVEEECDESLYWLEVIVEAGLMQEHRVSLLHKEANEILSIVVASIKTLRARGEKNNTQRNTDDSDSNSASSPTSPPTSVPPSPPPSPPTPLPVGRGE